MKPNKQLYQFKPLLALLPAGVQIPFGNVNLSVAGIVDLIIRAPYVVAIFAAIIFMVLTGIKFITAGGDVEKIKGARRSFISVIIGLIVVILAFAIVKLVAGFFGVNINNLFHIPDRITQ